ncbi:VCBS domain-containing protein [Bradyrhizobium liaoningense]|uniref:beta strand repeat-containing protein n=1 Tax=Bradyrhizobium liaoningense TaxID=43992 RepID=UPI001BA80F27|nr:Ig-like domain-containing protein [Bradyrhizobium liaoningense]MBR0739664.1 VCBS domain-containing protein [Bradyrhizobium liaoningense]
MATVLSVGDIAIVRYNSFTTNAFTFVFLRDVDAGTTVNFTDNGWLAAGGFRLGEATVTYTAPSAITAGTIVTLTGLNLDDAGDQIIAYQGPPASPTILYLVDLADNNNTVAGDATSDNTTALPPGLTLDVNAVGVAFDNAIYAGPTSGSPAELFAAISNAANWIDSSALPPPLFSPTNAPIIDLDADDSTHGGVDYRTNITANGPAVPISDADIDISDTDGTDISEAQIQVKGAAPGDLLAVAGVLPAGIVASAYDPSTGILTLTGTASHADYEAAILQVAFSTTASLHTQKQIEVGVFDGEAWSSVAKAFITVAAVNPTNVIPPVLDLDANNSDASGADYTATFTSGGPAIPIADIDTLITDADSTTIASATITIGINRQSDDVLAIVGALPGGITDSGYNASTGVITLTGVATFADYQSALQQIAYSSTNPTPFTGDRVITVTVNDGDLDSNVATTYMHVAAAPADVPPVLNLDADLSTIGGVDYLTTFAVGGPAVAIADTDVLITDADDTEVSSATITLTNPGSGDILVAGALPAGITASAYNPVTGVITLTGAASLADYQTALRQITFDNTGAPSTETRIIDVVVNDGTADSNLAQAIIEVTQVNALAPVVDLDADNSTVLGTSFRATFTEGGAAVPIADIDTSITDGDSTTLASATITLKSPQAGDLLAVSGVLPGGIVASGYDPSTGILTLSGIATLAGYQTALEMIRFSATGDNPVAGNRIVQVVVNDGANDSNAATALLTVAAVNDAPVLVITNATYTENDPSIALSPLASVTDLDSTDLNFAAVHVADGSFAGDGDILSVGGLTSGTVNGITFAWVSALHALTFNGASSVANYQALLQTVAFQSTSDNPTNYDANPQRTLTWTVSDGTSVTTATSTLDIIPVNDAAVMTANAAAVYTENDPPMTVSPGSAVTDVDDLSLIAGAVRIADGALDGDILSVNGLQTGSFLGINFAYSPLLHTLTFTRPASIADYQAFVEAVQFSSSSDDPTNIGLNPTRTLSWGVFDGAAISDVSTTTIQVIPIDDPAVAQNDALTTTENTAITTGNVFIDNGFGPDSDPDSTFAVTAVSGGTVGTQFMLPSGALLTVNANGTFSYDPNHVFDYLPTPASGASDLTVTDTFTYTVTGGNTATVTVTVSGVDTDDILFDSPSIDTLAGGIRDDYYYVNDTGDVVIEAAAAGFDTVVASIDYTLPANNTVEVLNVLGAGLTGTGSEGHETFISSFGPNTLIGLGGDDDYYVRNTGDVVTEAPNGGFDTVLASVNYTLPASNTVELLNMLGSGLTGTGSGGAETFISSSGPNTLIGLGGNDTYYVNSPDDVVIEAANGGYDTIAASVDYTQPANVEALYILGSRLTGTGSGSADSLLSSGGPNTLVGLSGDDLYYVNNVADVVIEAANEGYDTVMATVSYTLPANVEAMYMTGSGLTGTGSSGADTLISLGANTLVGAGGNDTFVFSAGSANGATVADFDHSQADLLLFSGFGTEAQGATIGQIGTTDQWEIHSGLDAHNETITLSNHAALRAGDWVFV